MTWIFQLTTPAKIQVQEYPKELLSRFDVKETLGTGAFSEVKLGIERSTGICCAIKILDKFKYTGGTTSGDTLKREVEILKGLSHPNIIQVLDVIDSERMMFIVLELAKGGELFEQIAKRQRHTEDEARQIFVQLLNAIEYLQAHNICHRDLKPENILLEDFEGGRVKLTDFGLSRFVGEAEIMKTMCGTPMYLAPEVLALSMGTREPSFERAKGYGKAVDMWSLGVILYLLLSGAPPWEDKDLGLLCETVLAGRFAFPVERWDGVSEAAKHLCKRLLTVSPEKRITVEQALQHDWITGAVTSEENLSIMTSPPRKVEFAVPTSKKRVARRLDVNETTEGVDNNSVMRLIRDNETVRSSPNLKDRPVIGSPVVLAEENTPLLPPVPVKKLKFEADDNTVRRLGFETPEKKLP